MICDCDIYFIEHTWEEHYGDEAESRWCPDCEEYELTNSYDYCLECGAPT